MEEGKQKRRGENKEAGGEIEETEKKAGKERNKGGSHHDLVSSE